MGGEFFGGFFPTMRGENEGAPMMGGVYEGTPTMGGEFVFPTTGGEFKSLPSGRLEGVAPWPFYPLHYLNSRGVNSER